VAVLAVIEEKAPVQDQDWIRSEARPPHKIPKKRLTLAPFILTFLIMGLFWVVFSEKTG